MQRDVELTDSISSFPALRDPASLPAALARPVLAIGNFDGLHRGHEAVVDAALAMGSRLVRPTCLLTFEPHPRQFFRPDVPLFRLTDEPAKALRAQRCGLDGMVTLSFDAALAAESAERFILEILIAGSASAPLSSGLISSSAHAGQARLSILQRRGLGSALRSKSCLSRPMAMRLFPRR